MSKRDEIRSVVIFAGTSAEAVVVKSLLENAEIQAFLKDDLYATIEPWTGTNGTVKVIISSADITRARLVIDDYDKNRSS